MLEVFNQIKLEKKSNEPLYKQMYAHIKNMIIDGVLSVHLKLPSVRQFCSLLKINQVTVVTALKLLEKEGYIYSKPSSGFYVSPDWMCKDSEPKVSHFIDIAAVDEIHLDAPFISSIHMDYGNQQPHINFASSSPSPDMFPIEDFKCVLNEVLERDKGLAFSYQESQGYEPLRHAIASMLSNNNISCTPEHIQIISGAQQGIDIAAKMLLSKGSCIVTESPTYSGAAAVFKTRQAEIIDIEMTESGPDMNIMEYLIKKHKPSAVYTIPSFQNPTGMSYSEQGRHRLIELAEKYDFFIIEDDYVSELDFCNKKYPRLKEIDKYSRVIFIKSFSKLFMPGLRLGFMVMPSSLVALSTKMKLSTDISTSGFIQRTFELYLRKNLLDKHINKIYEIFLQRYKAVINYIDRYAPSSCTYKKPEGGLSIWLHLPSGLPVNVLEKMAWSKGITFAPGRIFYSSSGLSTHNNIRISFASADEELIEHGLKTLFDCIKHLHSHKDKKEPIL